MKLKLLISTLIFLSLIGCVSASSGYVSDISFSEEDGIYSLSQSPQANIEVTNPSWGDSHTARIKISIDTPTTTIYSGYSNEFEMLSGNTYNSGFGLSNNLEEGIGWYEVTGELEEKKCFIICWWSSVDDDTNDFGVIFDRPTGFDDYLSDDDHHHPSDDYILNYALTAVTDETNIAMTTPANTADPLQHWVKNYITYTHDYLCDGDQSNCGDRSTDFWILYDKKGDCNDFADLYVSLSRALNIPSGYLVGYGFELHPSNPTWTFPDYGPQKLFYYSGGDDYFGHAWAESYIGGWKHIDPTWDEYDNPSVYNGGRDYHLIVRRQNDYSAYGSWTSLEGWDDVTRERPYDSTWISQELKAVKNVPKKVFVGDYFYPEIWLENMGDISIEGAKIELLYSEGIELIDGLEIKEIERIYHDTYDYTKWEFYADKNGTQEIDFKVSFDNLPDEEFSFTINSTFPENFNPPNVTIDYFFFDEGDTVIGRKKQLTLGVYNPGDIKAKDVSIDLSLPQGISLENDEDTEFLFDLDKWSYKYFYWEIVANISDDYTDELKLEASMDPQENNGFSNDEEKIFGFKAYSGSVRNQLSKNIAEVGEEIKLEIEIVNDGFNTANYSAFSRICKKDTLECVGYVYDSSLVELHPGDLMTITLPFYPQDNWIEGEYSVITALTIYLESYIGSVGQMTESNLTILPHADISVNYTYPYLVHNNNYFLVELDVSNEGNVEIDCIKNTINMSEGLSLSGWQEPIQQLNLALGDNDVIQWWVYVEEIGEHQFNIITELDESCGNLSFDNLIHTGDVIVQSGNLSLSLEKQEYGVSEDIPVNVTILNDGLFLNNYILNIGVGFWETLSVIDNQLVNISNVSSNESKSQLITFAHNQSRELGDYVIFASLYVSDEEAEYGFILNNFTMVIGNCTPNWTGVETCNSNDSLLVEYADINDCYVRTGLEEDLDGKPNNTLTEFFCDYDNDGFIGDMDKVNTTIQNLTKQVTNDSLKFYEENKTLFEFEFNSSDNQINLANLYLECQSNETGYAFMVIRGIDLSLWNQTKTVYLDRIVNGTGLCIKDEELTLISEISDGCNADNETWVACPSVNGDYTCNLTNNNTQYMITGLKHSGIKEQETYCGDETCNGGESCSSCATDCGACPVQNVGGGGGGGGGGGSTPPKVTNQTNTTSEQTPEMVPLSSDETETPNGEDQTQEIGTAPITGATIGTFIKRSIIPIVIIAVLIVGGLVGVREHKKRKSQRKIVASPPKSVKKRGIKVGQQTCNSCGRNNTSWRKFCVHCGKSLILP